MTHDDRPLVAAGLREAAARSVQEAAAAIGAPFAHSPRCDEVGAVLDDVTPLAIVLPLGADGAAKAFEQIRRQARFAPVPIFGVVDAINDLTFTELFVWGGDDLVQLSTEQSLLRRLRALRAPVGRPAAAAEATSRPCAVVAGADSAWRTILGRSLSNGGFSIRFAMTAEGLVNECVAEGVRVAVVADDLGPSGPLAALVEARARGSNAGYVLVAPPKRIAHATRAMKEMGRASVADGFAPPENVLFLVNELLAPRGVDKRASPRLLYGTSIEFRAAGRDEGEIGFSYNVSAGGLFVRTLAPLDPGQEVWLEMWAPRSERRVRLAGVVAWRRPFGPNGGATVPAGFGVRIDHGLGGDLERWSAGYHAFASMFQT